jgi:hypothetical protein
MKQEPVQTPQQRNGEEEADEEQEHEHIKGHQNPHGLK